MRTTTPLHETWRSWQRRSSGIFPLLGKKQPPRPFLYREFPGYGGQQSIRVGDWKAIRQGMNYGNLDVELYNLSDDIGERSNVARRHPDIVDKLTRLMAEQHTKSVLFPLRPLDAPALKRKPDKS